MPPGWQEKSATAGDIPNKLLRKFTPPGMNEIEMCLFYRGRPVHKKAARDFSSLLKRSPHTLTEQEVKDMTSVLLNMGDNQFQNSQVSGRPPAFLVQLAETGEVREKNVLVVQGTFQRDGSKPLNQCINVFIDAEGTGRFVFEVFLLVPSVLGGSVFDRQLTAFRQAVSTIQWANQLDFTPPFQFGI